jgi:hypothetical protein
VRQQEHLRDREHAEERHTAEHPEHPHCATQPARC